jgi:hypothetical protein
MEPLTQHEMVFDLDASLISSSQELSKYNQLKLYSEPRNSHLRCRVYRFDLHDVTDTPGSGIRTEMWGVYRPYLFEFLDFAGKYFKKLHIWSAGQYKYVHSIRGVVFPSTPLVTCSYLPRIIHLKQPSIILTYDDCDRSGEFITKPLKKLYELSPQTKPAHTLILDDNPTTFTQNVENAIQIPPYEPEFTPSGISQTDIALLQLMHWLMQPEVIHSTDLCRLDKSRIFTTISSSGNDFFDNSSSKENGFY